MIRPTFKLDRVTVKAERVIAQAERANARPLFKIAGFIRNTAKRSMRKRKGPSAPGTPPSAHDGDRYGRGFLLRTLMSFDVDRKNLTTTVGPKRLRSKTLGKVRARKPVPNLHEFGGVLRVEGKKPGATPERVKFPARPYMAPALEKARQSDRLRSAWSDILGKGGSR